MGGVGVGLGSGAVGKGAALHAHAVPADEGVRFGLTYGALVPGCEPYLQRGARKQVLWRDLSRMTTTDDRSIRQLLRAALVVDRERAGGLR